MEIINRVLLNTPKTSFLSVSLRQYCISSALSFNLFHPHLTNSLRLISLSLVPSPSCSTSMSYLVSLVGRKNEFLIHVTLFFTKTNFAPNSWNSSSTWSLQTCVSWSLIPFVVGSRPSLKQGHPFDERSYLTSKLQSLAYHLTSSFLLMMFWILVLPTSFKCSCLSIPFCKQPGSHSNQVFIPDSYLFIGFSSLECGTSEHSFHLPPLENNSSKLAPTLLVHHIQEVHWPSDVLVIIETSMVCGKKDREVLEPQVRI